MANQAQSHQGLSLASRVRHRLLHPLVSYSIHPHRPRSPGSKEFSRVILLREWQ